jgi:hypothetical protein
VTVSNLRRGLRAIDIRLRSDHAAQRVTDAFAHMSALLRKAGFNADQLRNPAGQSGGGRWTSDGGAVDQAGAKGRGSVPVRIGNRVLDATPGQAARLAAANTLAQNATARVRERDPNWTPRPSLSDPNSVDSEIARQEFNTREANARNAELDRLGIGGNNPPGNQSGNPPAPRIGEQAPPARDVMNNYREISGMPAIGDRAAKGKDEGTVAYTEIDGKPVIGVNSNATGYTAKDEEAAKTLRDELIAKHPEVMKEQNAGWKPNDVVSHAETTALLRAAEENGGSLSGKTLDVMTDRRMCSSCQDALPLVGSHLGNPAVRFIEPDGTAWIMKNGEWILRGRP